MASFSSSPSGNPLTALYDEDWRFEMNDNPEFSSLAGFHDMFPTEDPQLQRVTSASYAHRVAHSRAMLVRLDEVLRSAHTLTERDRVYSGLFRNQHAELIDAIEGAPLYLLPINSMGSGGPLNSFSESIEWMRFESTSDFEKYLRRCGAVALQLSDFKDCMREGVASGYTASTAMVRDVEKQLEAIISGSFADLNAPLVEHSAVLADNETLKSDIKSAIEGVRDAFTDFLSFLRTEYLPHCRTDPSCAALPNGADIYQKCLRFHTTTTLSPEEVFQVGIAEVAKIEERYRNEVLIPLGYGTSTAEFNRFVEHVRSDPQFYVKTPEELLDVYKGKCAEIINIMPQYFNEIPSTPLEITSKNVGPAAYYLSGTPDGKRPGRFYVNVSHIEKRPLYESVALSLHEAIPGHHHQISIATENESIPQFMRFIEDRRYESCPCRRNMYTGYLEGWALYCEYLGEEMGMYKNPYELFGRLSMDMMRAVRLVVDTGLHYKNWGIERSIDYMMEKTGMHRHEVEVEIYRYAGWPGQACAYKIGQIEFLRLRKRAEDQLGPKFNLRDFHSVCLNWGPLPLTELANLVESYIQAQSKTN